MSEIGRVGGVDAVWEAFPVGDEKERFPRRRVDVVVGQGASGAPSGDGFAGMLEHEGRKGTGEQGSRTDNTVAVLETLRLRDLLSRIH